jgi:hypothetical protein
VNPGPHAAHGGAAPDEGRLFEERLPWYVNGTLGSEEREWVERLLARSESARRMLAREHALAVAIAGAASPAAQDIGLESVRRALRARPGRQAATAGAGSGFPSWLRFLLAPQVAGAMAIVLVVQAGAIAWFAQRTVPAEGSYRGGIAVAEARTLRVTFVPGATEAQVRAALQAAGARIVGGPNLVGEYWLASPMVSVDEMRDSLRRSGLMQSIETDLAGPH